MTNTKESMNMKKQLLRKMRRSFATAFLLITPIGIIVMGVKTQSAVASCNPFGCSQSSAAQCNPFGCPNSPLGEACTPFGCPASPQPSPQPSQRPPSNNPSVILTPNQQSAGGSADGIVSCMQGLLYKREKVCASKNMWGECVKYEENLLRTEISEGTAAQACQNAR
jgi:hypothetical protein